MTYSARDDYQSRQSAQGYEARAMYRGAIGRRRTAIERAVIGDLAATFMGGSTVLDCPCGNGRWFEAISARAGRIVARDISTGMVEAARERSRTLTIPVDIALAEAESLDLADQSVDDVFSYALMKHLPVAVQAQVLSEFARVSRRQVVCSFAVLSPLSYVWWRATRQVESFPVSRRDIDAMARRAGLKVEKIIKVSQPLLGLEHFVVFERAPDKATGRVSS